MLNPKDDEWTFQSIGTPFPENPVKACGQENMYVALWYKHGKPIHGRCWNDGGVVACSFPYSGRELKHPKDFGGKIQLLTYNGNHNSLGFWYNWIPYNQRKVGVPEQRKIVRCGQSMPILWLKRKKGALLGDMDITEGIARFSTNDKVLQLKGERLDNMYIISREFTGSPPTCACTDCVKETSKKPEELIMFNSWKDFRQDDPFPMARAVRALFKSLNTLPDENSDQYVALWYKHGEPIMGRAWNEKGKISASFGVGGLEHTSKIGSIQILFELPKHARGFDYDWRPYPEAASFYEPREWYPIHVVSTKGNCCPAVITVDDKQILGNVDIKNETASYGYRGNEVSTVGPLVHTAMVLCRKARPGCKFDD